MSKIRVIDLLNKRANGEEVPKKIRIAGWCYKFEWVKHDENYYDKNADIDLMSCLSMCEDEFNREVEIIEEEKKIELPKKLKFVNTFSKNEGVLKDKINELIAYLKYKEEEKEK